MGDFNGKAYGDPFIGSLVAFVAGDEFQTLFENFFVTNATDFSNEEEHKLMYFEIYQKFQSLFEGQLEDFCQNHQISQTEFVKRCREASIDDPKAMHYINILLSSVEYETFVKLMRIMRPVAIARKRLMARAEAKTDEEGDAVDHDNKSSSSSTTPSKGVPSSPAKDHDGDNDNDNDRDDRGSESDSKTSGYNNMAASDAKKGATRLTSEETYEKHSTSK